MVANEGAGAIALAMWPMMTPSAPTITQVSSNRAEDATARQQQANARNDLGDPRNRKKTLAKADSLELLNHQAGAGELGVAGGDRDHAEQNLRCVDADGLGHGVAPSRRGHPKNRRYRPNVAVTLFGIVGIAVPSDKTHTKLGEIRRRSDTHDTKHGGRETPTIQAAATIRVRGSLGCLSRMDRAAVKTKNKAKPSAGSVKGTKRLKGAKRSKREPCSEPPEDALASAERYALALESINENLYDWDIVNDTVYFAPGLFKILGIKPEQMRTPKDWTDRIHPGDQPLFKYTLAEHLKGNTPRFSMELRYRDGAGNWRWARQAGIAVRGPDGRALRMVGAAGDITEAKSIDEAMTASADLLKVMSRSTFELQTVLDTLVTSATRLCDSDAALIFRRENGHYRLAAQHGLNREKHDFMRDREISPARTTLVGRTALERRIVHIPDVAADPDYHWPEASTTGNFRAMLGVPLLREGVPIGVMTLTRDAARPFSAKQIELISTFADQAVIAIETVRLFNEVQERTAEIERTRSILATMIDNMDDGLALMTPTADGDVRCDFVNQRMMEFQRYPADVVFPGSLMSNIRRFQIGRGDFGKVDDVEAKVKELVDHLKVPGGVRFERPSPSGHYIEVSYKPLDNGTIISIHRNITALKEREASLAAAKEAAEAARADAERTRQSMQTVLDNMNEAVQLFDKNFDIEFVNRRLLEFHAYPPEIGGPGASGFDGIRYMAKRGDYGPDVDVEKVVAERAARIRDPNGSRHVRRTGNGSLVEFTFNPLPDGRVLAVGHDVTEVKHREEALQAAADILKLISRDRFDLQTVLETLVESASRLCEADGANIFQLEGDTLRVTASHGYSRELTEFMLSQRVSPSRNSLSGRTVLDRAVVHIPDIQADPEYTWAGPQKFGEYRTMLGVPLMREGTPIGVLAMTRDKPRPFTPAQIELISTFADQAVIAIETLRLFNEVQERTAETERTRKVMQTAFDNMGDGVALLDKDMRLQFMSQERIKSRQFPPETGAARRAGPRPDAVSGAARRLRAGCQRRGYRAQDRRSLRAHDDARRHPLRAAGKWPLHRIQLQADQRRRHARGVPRHHRAARARGGAGRGEGGRRAHPRADADHSRQHGRRRHAVGQGLRLEVQQSRAHRAAALHARHAASGDDRLRHDPLPGAARRIWRAERGREVKTRSRRSRRSSAIPRVAATSDARRAAATSSSTTARWPTAACSGSIATSPS